jgi:hypothetical protein
MIDASGPTGSSESAHPGSPPLLRSDLDGLSAEEFRQSFGEDLEAVLDMTNWRTGVDLALEYRRIEGEVKEAVAEEDAHQRRIRDQVFPHLEARRPELKNAGQHAGDRSLIAKIHRELLFSGGVEACDGAVQVHDTIPLTIYQVGASLVSYRGDQGSWCQRFFRKDLRQRSADPALETIELLERRARRGAAEANAGTDRLGELAQRAIGAYAERAILLHHAHSVWRMGHGNPVPYELLTGGGMLELMTAATNALRQLIEQYRKFVFVAGEPRERLLLTIGQALRPLEYAIVGTLDEWLYDWFDQLRFRVGVETTLRWDGEPLTPAEWIPRFIDRVAAQVVVGLFRATPLAPAQLFYAHVDHARLAAHIVLADSVLQEGRGFPLLLDLAQRTCRSVYGGGNLAEIANAAYGAAGVASRYVCEQP